MQSERIRVGCSIRGRHWRWVTSGRMLGYDPYQKKTQQQVSVKWWISKQSKQTKTKHTKRPLGFCSMEGLPFLLNPSFFNTRFWRTQESKLWVRELTAKEKEKKTKHVSLFCYFIFLKIWIGPELWRDMIYTLWQIEVFWCFTGLVFLIPENKTANQYMNILRKKIYEISSIKHPEMERKGPTEWFWMAVVKQYRDISFFYSFSAQLI